MWVCSPDKYTKIWNFSEFTHLKSAIPRCKTRYSRVIYLCIGYVWFCLFISSSVYSTNSLSLHHDFMMIEWLCNIQLVLLILNQSRGGLENFVLWCVPPPLKREIKSWKKPRSSNRKTWRYHRLSVAVWLLQLAEGWHVAIRTLWLELLGLSGRGSGFHGCNERYLTASAAILRYMQLCFVLVQTCFVLSCSTLSSCCS